VAFSCWRISPSSIPSKAGRIPAFGTCDRVPILQPPERWR
jgi:hypothetical protein